jgi:glycosyltransferase involved in cell wall biosynthesis
MPDVSVLMPVYNCEKYVARAIESILHQSHSDWELFVCDDGSTDGTRQVLEHYRDVDSRVRIIFNRENIGKIETINKAYPLLRGDFVVFHDADDVSHPDRFALQVKALKSDVRLGLVGSGFAMIDGKDRVLDSVLPATEHDQILEAIKKSSPFHFPTVMFRKTDLDAESHLFRPFFGDNNEDVDLAYRILTRSKGKNVDKILYVYRILQDSVSRRKVLRNSIFFYSVARDLALSRITGEPDWLNDPGRSREIIQRYENLRDPRSILLYANCVSYFLSYRLYAKALHAALISFKAVSWLKGLKLTCVTAVKIAATILRSRPREKFNMDGFLKQSPA